MRRQAVVLCGVVAAGAGLGLFAWARGGGGEPPAPVGPADVTVAADGTVYVADPEGHQVLAWRDGAYERVAGTGRPGDLAATPTGRATDAGLRAPVAVAVGPDDRDGDGADLYVADRDLGVFRVAEGRIEPVATDVTAPSGLAVTSDGEVYVLGSGPSPVVRVTAEGTEPVAAFDMLITAPEDVAALQITDDGAVLVWDNQVGLVAAEQDETRTVVARGDRAPVFDFVLADDGTVVAAHWADQVLTRFAPDGTLVAEAGLPFQPRAVATDHDGALVVLRSESQGGGWLVRVAPSGDTVDIDA